MLCEGSAANIKVLHQNFSFKWVQEPVLIDTVSNNYGGIPYQMVWETHTGSKRMDI